MNSEGGQIEFVPTPPFFRTTVLQFSPTTLGSLKDEIDRYSLEFINLNRGKTRLEVPCMDLLSYLQRAFLPKNDVDHLREALGSLRQNSGESKRNFNQKLRDLAGKSYK